MKLKWYNYAESFQLRINEEMKKGISEQIVRTNLYNEIISTGEFMKNECNKIQKRIQKAKKFYDLIKQKEGREIIKYLNGINVDMIRKLSNEEMENIVKKMNGIENQIQYFREDMTEILKIAQKNEDIMNIDKYG